jgi:Domain of unknown function (DUF4440)
MKRNFGWKFLLGPLVCVSLACPATKASDVSTSLRALDQKLLDAVGVGGVALWQETLAPEAVYVDENGVTIDRAEFLKQLQPFPAGVSGHLQIQSFQAQTFGNTATVVHQDDEEENFHGQTLHAQYLTTETWQQRDGRWQLLLVHVTAVPRTPKPIRLSTSELSAYQGRYTAGAGLFYSVSLNGDQLEGGRVGRPASRLEAEVRDVFFIEGQPRSRKIFIRDTSGEVTAFIDRREGQDLLWKRDDAAPSAR